MLWVPSISSGRTHDDFCRWWVLGTHHICRCSPHRSWLVTDINRKCTDYFHYNLSPHAFLLLWQGKSFVTVFLLLRARNHYHIYIMALPPAFVSSLTTDHHLPINLNQYQWIVVVILSFPPYHCVVIVLNTDCVIRYVANGPYRLIGSSGRI